MTKLYKGYNIAHNVGIRKPEVEEVEVDHMCAPNTVKF